MIYDIIRLYRIGKELGLTKKEINKTLIFDNTRRPKVYLVLLFLTLFIIFIFSIFSVSILQSQVFKNTYARGTLYSTIKITDFKKANKHRIIKKIL